MINLRDVESIIYIIVFIIAYLIAETFSGWFRAYTAQQMGDDTPAHLGFLSFNPLVHIDPVGMFFLIVYGVGWGRSSPVNPYNIEEPHRTLKLLCVYFSDTFAHLVIAIVSFVCLLWGFGISMMELAERIILNHEESLFLVADYYPQSSSFTLNIAMVLVVMVYLSIILAVLNFLINGFRLLMVLFFQEVSGLWYIDLLVPILLIMLFVNPLQQIVAHGIIRMAYFLVNSIGVF